jgi:hypothetical protein
MPSNPGAEPCVFACMRAMDTRKQYGSTQRRPTPEGRGLVKEHPEA